MDITNSDLIAIGSALVAGLSALYARWAVKAAKHQNEIAIHGERLKVYIGVGYFCSNLTQKGSSINENDVRSFHEWVLLSEFYFNKSIHQRLDAEFSNSLDLQSKNDELLLAKQEGKSNLSELSDQTKSISRNLRDECISIRDSMKDDLRLAKV